MKHNQLLILFVLFIGIITIAAMIPCTERAQQRSVPERFVNYKTINVTKAYVLSLDNERGRNRMTPLRQNFARYAMPPIEVFYGITPDKLDANELITNGILHPKALGSTISPVQLASTISHYRILQRIADQDDEWVYVFEDDARVINCNPGTDLTIYNVPHDTEMVVLSRGMENVVYSPSKFYSYETTSGGGLQQSNLVSKAAATKLVRSLVPIWQVMDKTIYRGSCSWDNMENKYEPHVWFSDTVRAAKSIGASTERASPCVVMYEFIKLFEQTSNPTPPNLTAGSASEAIKSGSSGYAIPPLDWVDETSLV